MAAAGVWAISFDQCMDLLRIEDEQDKDVWIIGNLDPNEAVEQSTPSRIKAAATDLAYVMGTKDNYVMSTGCALPPSTPVENAAAFTAASRKALKKVRDHGRLLNKLQQAVFVGDPKRTAQCIDAAAKNKIPVSMPIDAGLMRGIRKTGALYEAKKRFLPDVLLSTEAFYRGFEQVKPLIAGTEKQRPDVVLGTVRGDFHEIGKDLVRILFEINGIRVLDLGVDVSPEDFVSAAVSNNAPIIGLSAFITSAGKQLKAVMDMVQDLEDTDLCVIMGGAAVNHLIADDLGASGYAKNAVEAVGLVRKLLSSQISPVKQRLDP
jgi:methanogenic corrinoid protein MtbC1